MSWNTKEIIKVLRFLDCGVRCIPMIRTCGVTDSGFWECTCSVLGTSLVEQCSQVSGSTISHKTHPQQCQFS
jgi:hypothetical protein